MSEQFTPSSQDTMSTDAEIGSRFDVFDASPENINEAFAKQARSETALAYDNTNAPSPATYEKAATPNPVEIIGLHGRNITVFRAAVTNNNSN